MIKTILPCIFVMALFTGCSGDHFITDKAYRNKVEAQFDKQKELSKNRSLQLFSVFDQDIDTREKEALKFLYAYSSLNDLADYSGEFFLQNVRSSFAARDTFNWGKKVPENLFRHFVLPIRVNNENLDSSRWVFFAELKDRIRNLPMKEAVLEVNHWCHEKVTYRGSDSRTSSPLASVKTAWGRCGEESTFTVAALRSVGIPARQCYTPRWAHSDDNHAWVEVWVDGSWHFTGACEPEADLDLAWFTSPAKRAMLVNTTVFGDYEGPEDVLVKDPLFTRINILENYAPVKKVYARITDAGGNTTDSATVEFQLYNYAEFYPLYTTVTGPDGICSFTTGYGDLLVWASKDGKYGFQKLDVRLDDTVTVFLDRTAGQSFEADLDLVPPAEVEIALVVSDSAKKRNATRLAFEDSLRSSYENTFIDSARSARFARLVQLDPDTLWRLFHQSRGNWRELSAFITEAAPEQRRLIFPLLENISEKDLRDADTAVLLDHIRYCGKYDPLVSENNDFAGYVLSPRVDNEFLRPFRRLFLENFDSGFIGAARKEPVRISEWLRNNVILNTVANYSRAPVTPAGVYELRVADPHSANICFVAICRSFGIAARLDPATRVPQYLLAGKWYDVSIFDKRQHSGSRGQVVLVNSAANEKKPEYTTHYTLQEFRNGFFKTLDYEGSTLVQNFPCTLDIPAGPCLMVSGSRLPDGTVLSKLKVFEVKTGEIARQTIDIRRDHLPPPEYGTIDAEKFSTLLHNGLIIAWIDPGGEPTNHLLADLRLKINEFGKWKGSISIVLPTEAQIGSFVSKEGSTLPANIKYSSRETFPLKLKDIPAGRSSPKNLPVVTFINKNGVINYYSEGYRIGTGDNLLTLMNSGE